MADKPIEFNLRMGAAYLDLSEARMRTILKEGKIPGAEKRTVDPSSDKETWVMTVDGLDEYLDMRESGELGGVKAKEGTVFKVNGFRPGDKEAVELAFPHLTFGSAYYRASAEKQLEYQERAKVRAEEARALVAELKAKRQGRG